MEPIICDWLDDKSFAYSIAYDEAFIECITEALPIHKDFHFPGHVNVVVGQIGAPRNCFLSSLNGHWHMGLEHIRMLMDEGWGVGNHSYSHFVYPYQPGLDLYKEIVWSKYVLEELISRPVRIFAIPNDKYNYEVSLPLIKAHYLACIYIDGGPNDKDVDLYKIGNFMLASAPRESKPRTFFSKEPYDWKKELYTENLSFEFLKGKWLLDTTHLVQHAPPQPFKNVSSKDLYRRFSTIKKISKGDVWAATPDDIIDYIITRRNTKILSSGITEGGGYEFEISYSPTPGVVNRALTFKLPGLTFENPRVTLDGWERGPYPSTPKVVSVTQKGNDTLVTVVVSDKLKVRIEESGSALV